MGKMIFRKDKIIELCTNKRVLHLGFIQHSALYEDKIKNDDWLHEKINKVALNLIGFDYLKDDVEKIKEKYGYECYWADVTNSEKMKGLTNLGAFDVVVCGELIEHVDNPGLMLENIKMFMNRESILIITTPNPWSRQRINLINNRILEEKWLNKEHVCWYSYQTLKQLLTRRCFVEKFYGYYISEKKEDFQELCFMDKIKSFFKKKFILKKEYLFDGLFFVAKIK
ncbi:class I SAM-dependent methyltransferase [Anaerosinus sp.]